MKKITGILIVMCLLLLAGCEKTNVQSESISLNSSSDNQSSHSSSEMKSIPTKSFTNKYGTPTTKCAVSGCDNYIASSGDTNCCVLHSNRCKNCDKYIDGDAIYCMDCIMEVLQ